MKIKLSVVLIGAVLLSGLGIPSLAAEDVNLEEHYGAIIDNLINKCKFKTQMRYSKSAIIRNAAMLSCLKTTLYKKNRETLIQAMLDDNIGTKRYRVEHYLNTQFYDLVRSRKAMITRSYLGN